ncbi:MAG TPA: hypothetical protein VGL89_16080 [Candidatus Koribacter sp.]|jgi:hypothetical protein
MTMDDDKFEQHLRSFQPRDAAPLKFSGSRRKTVIAAGLAFACMLIAAAVILFPRAKPAVDRPTAESLKPMRRPVTLMDFNEAERENRLDEALALSAAQSLPRTDRPNSALNALSKE